MKAELSVKLLGLYANNEYNLYNAWWMDDQGGALYTSLEHRIMNLPIVNIWKRVAKMWLQHNHSETPRNPYMWEVPEPW